MCIAFRQICSELGAGLTYTELVSAKALCYQDKKSRQLLLPFPGEVDSSLPLNCCALPWQDWQNVKLRLPALHVELPAGLRRGCAMRTSGSLLFPITSLGRW